MSNPDVYGKQALVVDDIAAVGEVAKQYLQRMGMKVTCVISGREALEVLKNAGESLDFALVDVLLPEMDGIEIVREIRANFPNIVVVVMSGGGQIDAENYLEMAVPLGAQGKLRKPFDYAALCTAIEAAFTSHADT